MKKIILVSIFSCLRIFDSVTAQEVWKNVDGGVGDKNSPFQDDVDVLLSDTINDVLYAAGTFKLINDTEKVNGVAYWNGEKWQSNAHTSQQGTFNGSVSCLAQYHGKIFSGWGTGEIKYYDGTSWQLAGDFNGTVYCMNVYKDKLYVGGSFSRIGSTKTNYIACYDGTTWSSVKLGFYWSATGGGIHTLHIWKDKLYAGGAFDSDGTIHFNGIACWNDTTWSVLGKGVNIQNDVRLNLGWVNAIESMNDNLFVGGRFDSAGDVVVKNIARWDGSNWHDVSYGTNGEVLCMISKDSSIYVGGKFSIAGEITNSSSVARWDSKQWYSVGNGLNGGGGAFYSFALYNNELYGGGSFHNTFSGYYLLSIARLVVITGTSGVVESSVIIYPNPVTDKLRIKSGDELIEQVQINNIIGQIITIINLSPAKNEDEIDVTNLPTGLYFLKVKTKEGWQEEKFVKQ